MKVKKDSFLSILRFTLPLWALSIIISMSGCNEQSPIAGGAIFDDTINVNVISSDSISMFTGSSAGSIKPSASYAADLFLGSAKGFTSSILSRFGNVPDSLPDAEIISAKLILQPRHMLSVIHFQIALHLIFLRSINHGLPEPLLTHSCRRDF